MRCSSGRRLGRAPRAAPARPGPSQPRARRAQVRVRPIARARGPTPGPRRGHRVLDARLPGHPARVHATVEPLHAGHRRSAAELGSAVLSRHVSEPGLACRAGRGAGVGRLVLRQARRAAADLRGAGELAAERVRLGDPVGVNLHHAVMDDEELGLLDELCGLLAAHDAAVPARCSRSPARSAPAAGHLAQRASALAHVALRNLRERRERHQPAPEGTRSPGSAGAGDPDEAAPETP